MPPVIFRTNLDIDLHNYHIPELTSPPQIDSHIRLPHKSRGCHVNLKVCGVYLVMCSDSWVYEVELNLGSGFVSMEHFDLWLTLQKHRENKNTDLINYYAELVNRAYTSALSYKFSKHAQDFLTELADKACGDNVVYAIFEKSANIINNSYLRTDEKRLQLKTLIDSFISN